MEKLIGLSGKKTVNNLTGKRFGRLIVLSYIGIYKRYSRWNCRCDCGKMAEVSGRCLVRGNTISCGCYRREQQSIAGKKRIGFNKKPDTSLRHLIKCYKTRAVKKGIEFNISMDFFLKITKEICFYCGEKPQNHYLAHHSADPYEYNGIDRVDNSKGYIEGNCAPCCRTCNMAKSNMSRQVFLEWVRKVYGHNNLGGSEAHDEGIFQA